MAENKSVPERIRLYNTDRLPEFLGKKYEAMYNDRYRFFRATTHLFYEDVRPDSFLRSSPNAWLCGDLHLENFGSYKGDNRLAYFNVNDFDEAVLAPCLFDVVRMICSVFVASGNIGISASQARELAGLFADTYFDTLKMGYVRVLEKETTKGIMRSFLEEVQGRKRKKFLDKRTVRKGDKRKLLIDGVHFELLPPDEREGLMRSFSLWADKRADRDFYKIRDAQTRIAGTSSLGLRRYALLVEGNGSPDENYLLELKETRRSCVEKYAGARQPKWRSGAERIVEVQRRILPDPPALLNEFDFNNRNFVLKELQPAADRIDYTLFEGNIKKMGQVLVYMASIYAWGNLRSSGRQGSAIADELIYFAARSNGLKKELLKYAWDYSGRLFAYHKEFCRGVGSLEYSV